MKINLPDYKKIASEIKRNKISVENGEIENALSWLQRSRAKFIFKNEPCQKGDFVEVEYFSSEVEKGIREKDTFILGEGHFISDFEEKLVGMKPGEKKNNISLPISQGKETVLEVRMISVQKVELPEINDEFARGLSTFENLGALKKNIKEGLYLEKEAVQSQRIRQEILKRIAQNSEVEIPEVLVTQEQKQMMTIFKQNISQTLKISFENYLVKIKSSEEELLKSFLPQAKEKVKNFLVLNAIAQKENIEVSDEEIKEAINKQIKNLDIKETPKIDLNILKEYNKEIIKQEKTFQFLESFVQ